ncbi:NUDIX domain-containing protein [Gordonia sp. DT30]|uniref:NUDIX domain-containing protein n=1 Tax=unclassified Gordonia (in: high G+C Gram-positive bacteria) TaxID=2657482 RepID=UPI003CE7BF80
MSTDPSTDPSDVSDDVRRGGHHGEESAGGDVRGGGGQGRRRSRRGRRRRRGNPESRPDGETRPRADPPLTGADCPAPHPKRPSPADLADRASGKNRTKKGGPQNPGKGGGSRKNGGKNGTASSGGNHPGPVNGTRGGGQRHALPGLPGAPVAATPTGKGAARVSGPKPSDMAVMTAKITKTGLSHDSASSTVAPAAGRRRHGSRPERPERLRTVRETSAGGLVISDLDLPIDELSAALIGRIDRRGRMMWSLPKGHIETGETAEQTAVREVAEETGIDGLVVAPLGKIDYWFVSEGRRIHKTVHHYLLRSVGGELSDADYEVSAVAWVPLHELPRRLTYSDERRLARMARGVIADLAADPQRLARSEAESSRTEPNAYERAAAARNERRNETPTPAPSRRRRRRPRRPAAGDG